MTLGEALAQAQEEMRRSQQRQAELQAAIAQGEAQWRAYQQDHADFWRELFEALGDESPSSEVLFSAFARCARLWCHQLKLALEQMPTDPLAECRVRLVHEELKNLSKVLNRFAPLKAH